MTSLSASAAIDSATVASAMPAMEDRQHLQRLVDGYCGSSLVYVAAKLGLADLLADGPQGSDDLAQATRCHPGALRRILRGLVALGLIVEEDDGRLALSPVGAWLRSDHPLSLQPLAILTGEEYLAAWGDLLHSARTGETAFAHVFGMSAWGHRAQHPDLNAHFNRWMVQNTELATEAVVSAYDCSALRTICDVGGGHGALLAAVLKAAPAARGWLFDQPHVLAEAPAYLAASGVGDRCALVAGDFFAPYPAEICGLDAYVLKYVIHDWDDERGLAILARCRQAMGEASRLLLVECLLPVRARDDAATIWVDLRMLAAAGGRERSEEEYRALLAAAGLAVTRLVATRSGFSLIEALPAPAAR